MGSSVVLRKKLGNSFADAFEDWMCEVIVGILRDSG